MTIASVYPEGATPLDPNEFGGLRHRHIKTQAELDELEQANITSGLLWLSRTRRKDVLTHGFAVELHRRLFGEVWTWAGTFRRIGKNIGVDPAQIGMRLRAALDDALYWTDHGIYAPGEAAVRLHHRVVFIHPFANGNGRHGRILADAMLDKVYGAEPIDWTAGADLMKMNERRAAYISALRAADLHDFGPLLAFAGLTGKA
ncbi:mobile mystery protein B [Mesorhizobium comanense]|uniref:mobile mystery protein B n=1 Tax=Mesorhizobium comanense TaxID=2502215 RepID=UPI0010F9A9F5|nr:mobile mystery protein B [Mesorhizobium comanense]